MQLALNALIYIAIALPVSGQNAPIISGITWGTKECILTAYDPSRAFHGCYYSGVNVKHYPDGHIRLIKRSRQTLFRIDKFHGEISENDVFSEAIFSKFINAARSCEADGSCNLPQEILTYFGARENCLGQDVTYDLYHFFESEDVYLKMHKAGTVTVCSSDRGELWLYQWDGLSLSLSFFDYDPIYYIFYGK